MSKYFEDFDIESFIDSFNEILIFFNLNGQIIGINNAAVKLFCIEKEKLIKMTWKQIVSQLKLTFFENKSFEKIISSLPITNGENDLVVNNKEYAMRWFLLPWLNNKRENYGLILRGENISRIKELNSKMELLDNIIKYAPVMIYWKDKDFIHLGCNDNFAIAVGYTNRQDIVGKSDYELCWHEHAKKYNLDDKEVIKTGKPKLNIEDVIIDKEGKESFVISNKVPLRNSKGEIIGILGISTDITKFKHTENELKKSQASQAELEMLDNIIKYAPDLIYWKNKSSIHLGCNDKFAHAAGFEKREDVVGKSDYDFPWRAQAYKYSLDDAEVINTGQPKLNIEDVVLMKNGEEIRVISNKVPLRDSKGEVVGVLGISSDITHQKKIEQDLKKAKEAAEAASVAKTEFIANISHDIRTPLSGVVGLGNIVEQEIQDPKQKSHVHDMVKSADELLNMLNEILDVVSLGSVAVKEVQEEPFDLRHLVQTIADLERSSVDLKKIKLLTSIDEKIPSLLISDHKKIHHILLNLIGNAIKFTTHGHVEVKISVIEKQTEKISLRFEVNDTGKGIPPESMGKVFDAFYRVVPSYKGLDKGHGLGLHIAQTYTELLGGKISVESKLNEGSQFSFILMLKIAEKNAIAKNLHGHHVNPIEENSPLKQYSETKSTQILSNAPDVLIVEDNAIALTVAQILVKQAKCNTTTASNAETALELAQKKQFDLILSDVGLPGMSGIEFTRALREYEKKHNKKAVPIIALTGHAEGKIHQECISAGMNDVMIKPIRPEVFTEICDQFALFGPNKESSPKKLDEKKCSLSTNSEKGALGIDIPNTKKELFEINNQSIFDEENAIKLVGNDRNLLMKMLGVTITSIIPEELSRLKLAHENQDWQAIAKISHKLKSGFLSLGLTRAVVACKYLERYQKTGKTELLGKLYEQVINVLEITSKTIKTFIIK